MVTLRVEVTVWQSLKVFSVGTWWQTRRAKLTSCHHAFRRCLLGQVDVFLNFPEGKDLLNTLERSAWAPSRPFS